MYNNYTSIEQSETLVMLGMKADTSDAFYYRHNSETITVYEFHKYPYETIDENILPSWSITSLLNFMKDKNVDVEIFIEDGKWNVATTSDSYHCGLGNEDLMDVVFKSLQWLLINNKIKL